MTRPVGLWSPIRKRHAVAEGTPGQNPARWWTRRCKRAGVVPTYRVNVYFGPDGFQASRRMIWSDVSFNSLLDLAEKYGWQLVLCLTELSPGRDEPDDSRRPWMGSERGGQGFHNSIPRMDSAWYTRQVKRVERALEGRRELALWMQVENEADYCPAIHAAGRREEWYGYLRTCMGIVRHHFPEKDVATGGITLADSVSWGAIVDLSFGAGPTALADLSDEEAAVPVKPLNWWLAEQGNWQPWMIADAHGNNQPLSAWADKIQAWRSRWPGKRWGCLEDASAIFGGGAPRRAAMVRAHGGESYCDFVLGSWWGTSDWGPAQPYDCRSLALISRAGGKLIWVEKNATEARGVLQALTGDVSPPPPPPGDEPDPRQAIEGAKAKGNPFAARWEPGWRAWTVDWREGSAIFHGAKSLPSQAAALRAYLAGDLADSAKVEQFETAEAAAAVWAERYGFAGG